jgi:hypothetical protein
VLGSPAIYPLAIPLVGALIVPLLSPEKATLSFYEIAASVIPLFFIVLAIDARIFRLRRLSKLSAEPSHVERVRFLTGQIRQNFVFLMLASLGGGEYTATAYGGDWEGRRRTNVRASVHTHRRIPRNRDRRNATRRRCLMVRSTTY